MGRTKEEFIKLREQESSIDVMGNEEMSYLITMGKIQSSLRKIFSHHKNIKFCKKLLTRKIKRF